MLVGSKQSEGCSRRGLGVDDAHLCLITHIFQNTKRTLKWTSMDTQRVHKLLHCWFDRKWGRLQTVSCTEALCLDNALMANVLKANVTQHEFVG
eukprot:m.356836 g.356836  ORF g.356836 m.356836 type:complete len:94 (-) comp17639_c0_seq1:7296-7577(-)